MARLQSGKVPLTDRERLVLQMRLRGASFSEIGRRLGRRKQSVWESYRAALRKAKWRFRSKLKKERAQAS